jgi:hypothetical protein
VAVEHGPKVPASSLHCTLATPEPVPSSVVNVNEEDVLLFGFAGVPVIETVGSVSSFKKLRFAEAGFPAASVCATAIFLTPSPPENTTATE